MKKNILLIIIFITMFFIGNNDVHAKTCKIGDSGCTIDEIDLSKDYDNLMLSCVYEVELNSGNKYYNYIYYDSLEGYYLAGSSAIGLEKDKLKILTSSESPFISESAEKSLNNFSCPAQSYLDDDGFFAFNPFGWDFNTNEICFDNDDNFCKNNGEKKDTATNFNVTIQSKLERNSISSAKYAYDGTSYKAACSANNPLLDQYDNMCRYKDKTNSANTILLYYNNNSDNTYLIWYLGEDNVKLDLHYSETKDYSNIEAYNTYLYKYQNNIKNINSCPATLTLQSSSNNVVLPNPTHPLFSYKINSYDYKIYVSDDSAVKENGKGSITHNYELSECSKEEQMIVDGEIDCDGLFGSELLGYIDSAMNIIKIAIPILLICLITYDFGTAVFAGDDKEVSKAKGRAIKRIIIAVVVFFVPTIINFILNIANDVWPDANYEICGIYTEE